MNLLVQTKQTKSMFFIEMWETSYMHSEVQMFNGSMSECMDCSSIESL